MITYKKGNLFDTPDRVIVHGCNAQGVMGSGVAKMIRERFPKAFQRYYEHCLSSTDKYNNTADLLGVNVIVSAPHAISGQLYTIHNVITQNRYGKDGKQYVSYDAVDTGMWSVAMSVGLQAGISMPKIGAGLGGGHWPIIEAIINHRLSRHKLS